MITRYAVIVSGKIANIIAVDTDIPESYSSISGRIIPDNVYVEIGYSDDGVNFISPIKTPEQIAKESQIIADSDSLAQAKGDAMIQYLVNHTPAEIDAKVRQLVNVSGVTNLATATASLKAVEDLLVRIGIALSVAAKDRLR